MLCVLALVGIDDAVRPGSLATSGSLVDIVNINKM